MNWKNLFRFKLQRQAKPLVADFDKKLVKNLRHKFWPSWRQFVYIGRFLSKAEKRLLIICFFVFFLSLSGFVITLFFTSGATMAKSGGEYSEALIGQPKMISPIFASANDVDADISPLLYARLFKTGPNQKLIPELAAAQYGVDEEGKIYTIKLREDARWTDGEKIDADDVIYTIETIQNPETQSPLYTAFKGVIAEKINDYEIQLTLKEPFASFVSNLSLGIIPEHIFSIIPASSLRLTKENLQPKVTSGQWKFSKLTKNESGVETYTLEKNEKYFGLVPYLDKIIFKFYQDASLEAEELKTGNFMGVAFLPRNLSETYGSKYFNAYNLRLPQYTALFFNENNDAALKDQAVRLALTKAIDKITVARAALGEDAMAVDSPLLNNEPEETNTTTAFNAEEAAGLLDKNWERIMPEEFFNKLCDDELKKRLEEAKETPDFEINSSTIAEELRVKIEEETRIKMRPDQTYYRKNSKGEILSLDIVTNDMVEFQTAAESIALMWRAVGVQTNVIVLPNRQITKDVLKGRQYEVLLFSEIMGNDNDLFPFWHSSQTEYPGLNLAMFSDREADQLLEEARAASSSQARDSIYLKFNEILNKKLPAVFLYRPSYQYLIDKKVKGVHVDQISSPADRLNNIGTWYVKTKWIFN